MLSHPRTGVFFTKRPRIVQMHTTFRRRDDETAGQAGLRRRPGSDGLIGATAKSR